MNQSKGQRGLIIAGIIGIGIIFILGLVSLTRNRYDTTAPKEPEAAITQKAGVVITGSGDLANILLTEQFFAVRTNLVTHLKAAYPKAETAAISQTAVQTDGSIKFKLNLPTYHKTLEIKIFRLAQGHVSIQIPDDGYNSGTIQVYGSTSEGD